MKRDPRPINANWWFWTWFSISCLLAAWFGFLLGMTVAGDPVFGQTIPLPYDQQEVNGSCITADTLLAAATATDVAWYDTPVVPSVPAGVWVNSLWVPSAWLLGRINDYATCSDSSSPEVTPSSSMDISSTTTVVTGSSAPVVTSSTGLPTLVISKPYSENGVQVVDLTWAPAGTADLYIDSNQGTYVADDVSSPETVQVPTAVAYDASFYIVEDGAQSNSVSYP
jgi:hypothetical protein